MLRDLRLFPFTILMLAAVIGVAIWTQSYAGPLASSVRRTAGFAPVHVPRGEWLRLISSVFLTNGGAAFYVSTIMLAIGIGSAERLYGTRPAIFLFWGVHLTTLLAGSLLLAIPLSVLAPYRGTLLATARDVGPSAGYYGCLGAALVAVSGRWRPLVIGGIVLLLCGRLIWSVCTVPDQGRAMSADLSHLIAFPLGAVLALALLPPVTADS